MEIALAAVGIVTVMVGGGLLGLKMVFRYLATHQNVGGSPLALEFEKLKTEQVRIDAAKAQFELELAEKASRDALIEGIRKRHRDPHEA